jgi:hypothetical protein
MKLHDFPKTSEQITNAESFAVRICLAIISRSHEALFLLMFAGPRVPLPLPSPRGHVRWSSA